MKSALMFVSIQLLVMRHKFVCRSNSGLTLRFVAARVGKQLPLPLPLPLPFTELRLASKSRGKLCMAPRDVIARLCTALSNI